MNNRISTKIIVLKKTAYSESSLIVSTISPEYGKIDFLIKGARRITKHTQPVADIFRELSVEFRESSNGLNTPLSLDLVEEHDKVALNLNVFLEISGMASFLIKNTFPHVICKRAYSAFKNLLRKASGGSITAFDFTLFKLVFLHENGLLPELFETNADSSLQRTAEEKRKRILLNRLISYSEGRTSNIPKLSLEYQNKLTGWITNLCRFNGLDVTG
jgi:DNA repair protein RecO